MPQVEYTVDFHEGAWSVRLNEKRFGPYSTQETAIVAAMGAAHKAEAQGYEATVVVDVVEEAPAKGEAREQDAA